MVLSTQLSLLEDLASPRQEMAWPVFLSRYGGIVQDWCRQWGASAEEAEDIVQETLLRVFLNIGQFQHRGRYSFRSWLKTIARNIWLTLVRERCRVDHKEPAGLEQEPRFSLLSFQARESLEDLFNRMASQEILDMASHRVRARVSEATWAIFRMSEIEEVPGPEIARSLGVTIVAVHHATSRVRAMLRQEIRKIDFDTFQQ